MRANSSSTSDVPMPMATAAICGHGDESGTPTATKAPAVSRMMPGTAWWTWTPDAVTLFLNGPSPARMRRVMVRVARNVTTKAAKHRNSGSFPGSTMLRHHHAATRPR